METKLFEIRDQKTFLPVICVKCVAACEAERYLLAMAGYGLQIKNQSNYILYGPLRGSHISTYPFDHDPIEMRTNRIAHAHIIKHWDELTSGDVIDVQFILGETKVPKLSQRLEKI